MSLLQIKTAFHFLCLGMACLLFAQTSLAQTPLSKESKLKAAYLFNFTKYIEWPVDGFDQPQQKIQICLVADPAFHDFLLALIKGRTVGAAKRGLEVVSVWEAQKCHLTYVHQEPNKVIPRRGNSLWVLGSEQIKVPGAAIIFFQERGKLRFEVDRKVLQETQVSVSSELLKLARIK